MPGLSDFVPTVQAVEEIGQGVARVQVGEDLPHTVRRENCALTPLPDGSAFLTLYPGKPDALTCRLSPAGMVAAFRKAVSWPSEEEDGPPNLTLN